jgi:DNA-binding Lrp family transcriptional regulator
MRDLDEADRIILRLLLEDARRPYSDIAQHVDLSPPAVSDRIDRLRDIGVIRGFTVDIDRSYLSEGTPVLVRLRLPPTSAPEAAAALADLDAVEHVFRTADGTITLKAAVRNQDVTELLADAVPTEDVADLRVELLAETRWSPDVGDATLALSCAECGNAVTSEGTTASLDGTRYHFCCSSCEDVFRRRFAELEEGA